MISLFPSPPIDFYSQAVPVIEESHDRIHYGEMFFYSDSVTLGAGVSQDYMITVGTKNAHFRYRADGILVTSFFIYEAGDRTGTTLQTVNNMNRQSATTSLTTIHKGTSGGTTDGTLISTYSSGSAAVPSKQGSESSLDEEYVLKVSTKYILRITSGTAANLCNLRVNFYEHTPGT
jgi:hypothetical protein